jgi:predicted exporter
VDWLAVDAELARLDDAARARHGRFLADLATLRAGLAADRALTPGDLLDSPLGPALAAVWSERGGSVRLAVRLSAPDAGHGLGVGDLCAALGVVRDGGPWAGGAVVAATGVQVLGEALGEALVADLTRLAGWAGAAVVVLVLLLVGGVGPALAVLAALVAGAALTIAGMHLTGLAWNPMNTAAAPLLLGMGVDAAIFMVHALARQPRHRGGVVEALREALMPALFSTGTTILGFATLMLNPYRGVQSLGLLVVIGLGVSLFVALVAIPVIAALTTHRRPADIDTAPQG